MTKKYDIDVIYDTETQTDRRFVQPGEVFDNLLSQGKERRSMVGYDVAEEKCVGTRKEVQQW